MAEDVEFQLWLKSRFDGDPLKAAQAEFARTQHAAKQTDDSFRQMGYSADALKTQLMSLVAFAEVVAQFKEGFEQVAKLEQVFNQLERAAKQNGEVFESVKGKVTAFADSLKKVAGIDDDAAIAAVTKLYTATGNLEESLQLVRLAADVSVGALIPFEQANQLVLQVAQGNTRALRELGLSVETTGDKSKDAVVGLEKLNGTFNGATQGAKGLTVELNRLNEKWEDVRNTLVERLTPGISGAIKSVESFFTSLDGLGAIASEGIVRVVGSVMSVGKAIGLVAKGDFDGAKLAFRAGVAEIGGLGAATEWQAKETAARVAAIWKGAQSSISGGAVAPTGFGAGGTGAGGGTKGGKSSPELEAAQWNANQIALLQAKMYAQAEKAEQDHQKALLKMKVQGQKDEVRIERELDRERDRLMDAQTQRIRDEVRMRKAAEESKREMAIATANAAVGLAGQLFGESKALAVAQAVINTYEGATKALAQGGIYGPVLAAIVITAGLAQVAKISSTDASQGRGFDDPRNDQAAYVGGRRWAADMIGEFTKGVSSGWASGMGAGAGGSSTTYDNRRTFNVHMHGAGLIDPNNVQMMKQFKRTLDVIDSQVEGQRSVARRARG